MTVLDNRITAEKKLHNKYIERRYQSGDLISDFPKSLKKFTVDP